MPTFEQSKLGYGVMWRQMVVSADKVAAADAIVTRIVAHKPEYQKVESAIGVPWFFVACLHSREADLNFSTHLHNGDPLTARTYHVPAGRPTTGEPPFAWFTSAIDALTMRGLQNVKDWTVERMLYEAEGYNGWGYTSRDINSPYVWSWSNLQQPGKFVADGVFDSSAMDRQCGVAVLISRLMVADKSVADFVNGATAAPIVPPPTPTPTPAPAPVPAPIKETPVTTITLPNLSTIPFAAIEKQVEMVLPMLPVVATFVPGLAPVVAFVQQAVPFVRSALTVAAAVQADVAAGKSATVAFADGLRAMADQIVK